MRFSLALSALISGLVAVKAAPQGIDVSGHQGNVSWTTVKSGGVEFAYIKATEGTTYTSPYFAQQYNGAYEQSIIRGSYHFALPDSSSGSTQATFFVSNGGGWSADGATLPGVLDIEYNPYGATCYDLSQSDMVSWISDFSNTYNNLTGRYPVIYTTTDWWNTCTGDSAAFSSTNPLWIARYSSDVGAIPNGFPYYTFWQYSDSASVIGGDANTFNGDSAGLLRLARGS